MGPNTSTPNFNRAPNPNQGFNNSPQSTSVEVSTSANTGRNPVESAPMRSAEILSNAEALARPAQPVAPPPAVQPAPAVSASASGTKPTAATTDPATAQDADKIEQEWVDQAKKAISATREDPYAQAKAVSAMMRDYVKKRYGKVVGKAPGA